MKMGATETGAMPSVEESGSAGGVEKAAVTAMGAEKVGGKERMHAKVMEVTQRWAKRTREKGATGRGGD